ncbi:hypothetical protein TB2_027510 [Malus domestica]
MDTCAKLVDCIRWIVCLSSFAKHTTQYKMTARLAIMQKPAILAVKSMLFDQEDTKAAKEMAKIMATEAYFPVEKIRKLEFNLVTLKGCNISTPIYL